ncbi:hypothetical protein CXQ80_11090 [Pseudomonas sp. 02C 26]|uniref:hypothetical protein n=1 Tax=Pseudomonas sp. 02C 26 TaxID=2054914 RepID=UPI000C6DE6E6|nr:hypothetical protein [Pseudomonas sp. 02C 26]AUF96334.1 hypothetical protein CXQ80_11090 [Pseudomonas sp. 02C 26]
MAKRVIPELDVDKLRENSMTSIRLGVEDFKRCRVEGGAGDPARALSSIRNLFAGVLLLFKFKIATCADDPDDAAALIFNPPEVLPQSDGDGGIEWVPVGQFRTTTIDVGTIRKRFEAFGIEVDWKVVDKLQGCRNHLEHLHPAHSLGEVADFVAELFPLLRDFIENELEESPAEILAESWQAMLKHHTFFVDNSQRCEEGWAEASVPSGMKQWLDACKCPECGSTLLAPAQSHLDAGETVESDEEAFKAVCVGCGHVELIVPLMMQELEKAHDYDPRDGEEPTLEDCDECLRGTFVIHEQRCSWCGAELQYTECKVCEEPLGQDDQFNGGLCSYHAYMYEKFMRED